MFIYCTYKQTLIEKLLSCAFVYIYVPLFVCLFVCLSPVSVPVFSLHCCPIVFTCSVFSNRSSMSWVSKQSRAFVQVVHFLLQIQASDTSTFQRLCSLLFFSLLPVSGYLIMDYPCVMSPAFVVALSMDLDQFQLSQC